MRAQARGHKRQHGHQLFVFEIVDQRREFVGLEVPQKREFVTHVGVGAAQLREGHQAVEFY